MLRRPVLWLLLATAAVHWPALFGGFVYDDQLVIGRNMPLRNDDLWRLCTEPFFSDAMGYWRPLTSLSLWLGNVLGGAAGIHTIALLVHGAAGVMAFRLGRRVLTDDRAALLAALLFVVHPVQVESVAWCSALSGPLSSLLSLLAIDRALGWRERAGAIPPWGAAVWLFLALLAKESAIAALPLLLVMVAWAPGRTKPVRWRALVGVFAAVVAGLWLLRAMVFAEPVAGMAARPSAAVPSALRLLSAAPELLLRDLRLLVVPWPLTPFRTFAVEVEVAAAVAWSLGGAVFTVCLAAVWRRLAVPVRIGVTFVLLPLLPHLARFAAVGGYPLADRYLYLSVFGLGLVVAWLTRGRARWFAWILVAGCAALTVVQTRVWRDQHHLVAHGLRHAGGDANVHVMFGDLQLAAVQAGAMAASPLARAAYAEGERLAAASSGPLAHRALAGARLGLAWCAMFEQQDGGGHDPEALLAAFWRAVDTDDQVAAAWVGLGVANALAERPEAAERAFRRAIELDGERVEAWYDLGHLQAQLGRTSAARESLQQALRCDPDHGPARHLLDSLR